MWVEDREDIYQTTPELLTLYLRRRGIRQEDAVTKSGITASTLKRILSDEGPRRPTFVEIERLAATLGFTQRERTNLLASADYYPEQREILYLLTTWKSLLNACSYPIHVMDLRGFIWGGNAAWEQWISGAAPPSVTANPSRAEDDFAAARIKLALPGTHWLLMALHPASRLFHLAGGEDSETWRTFAAEQITRFRVATKRFEPNELMKSNEAMKSSDEAWPDGTPPWRQEIVEAISSLPGGIGDLARHAWRDAHHRQDRDIGGASSNQPRILNFAQVRLTLGDAQRSIGLLAATMSEDSRFSCVHWVPIDGHFPGS